MRLQTSADGTFRENMLGAPHARLYVVPRCWLATTNGGHAKRESGARPGLPRSGERKRPPSYSTDPNRLGSDGQ